MNELEISEYLLADAFTSRIFRGVISYDEFCCCEVENGLYVVNLSEFGTEGTHWVCLLLSPSQTEYFDSLANPPSKLEDFLRERNVNYTYNLQKLQGNGSDVCADYCILYGYFRSRGFTFQCFLDMFTNDHKYNDALVEL